MLQKVENQLLESYDLLNLYELIYELKLLKI